MKCWEREPNYPAYEKGQKSWDEKLKEAGLHCCEIDTPQHCYGSAITDCCEDLDGRVYLDGNNRKKALDRPENHVIIQRM